MTAQTSSACDVHLFTPPQRFKGEHYVLLWIIKARKGLFRVVFPFPFKRNGLVGRKYGVGETENSQRERYTKIKERENIGARPSPSPLPTGRSQSLQLPLIIMDLLAVPRRCSPCLESTHATLTQYISPCMHTQTHRCAHIQMHMPSTLTQAQKTNQNWFEK